MKKCSITTKRQFISRKSFSPHSFFLSSEEFCAEDGTLVELSPLFLESFERPTTKQLLSQVTVCHPVIKELHKSLLPQNSTPTPERGSSGVLVERDDTVQDHPAADVGDLSFVEDRKVSDNEPTLKLSSPVNPVERSSSSRSITSYFCTSPSKHSPTNKTKGTSPPPLSPSSFLSHPRPLIVEFPEAVVSREEDLESIWTQQPRSPSRRKEKMKESIISTSPGIKELLSSTNVASLGSSTSPKKAGSASPSRSIAMDNGDVHMLALIEKNMIASARRSSSRPGSATRFFHDVDDDRVSPRIYLGDSDDDTRSRNSTSPDRSLHTYRLHDDDNDDGQEKEKRTPPPIIILVDQEEQDAAHPTLSDNNENWPNVAVTSPASADEKKAKFQSIMDPLKQSVESRSSSATPDPLLSSKKRKTLVISHCGPGKRTGPKSPLRSHKKRKTLLIEEEEEEEFDQTDDSDPEMDGFIVPDEDLERVLAEEARQRRKSSLLYEDEDEEGDDDEGDVNMKGLCLSRLRSRKSKATKIISDDENGQEPDHHQELDVEVDDNASDLDKEILDLVKQVQDERERDLDDSSSSFDLSSDDKTGVAPFLETEFELLLNSELTTTTNTTNFNFSSRDAFAIYIQYLASALLDPEFLRLIARENDGYFLSARRKIEQTVLDKVNLIAKSSVWDDSLSQDLDQYPIFKSWGKTLEFDCEACCRSNHPATFEVMLEGPTYSAIKLWQRGDKLVLPDNDSQPPSSDGTRPFYRMGRNCHMRTSLFHRLLHFKYKLIMAIKTRIAIAVEGLCLNPPDPVKVIEVIVDDGPWISNLFHAMDSMMKGADKFHLGAAAMAD